MKLSAHQSSQFTKILCVGYSGSGKTGALAALAARGYKLRIADFDNGLDILRSYLTDPKSVYFQKNPKAIENVDFKTFRSKVKHSPDGKLLAQPKSWTNFVKALDHWADYEEIEEPELGPDKKPKLAADGSPMMKRITRMIPGSDLGSVAGWGSEVIFVVDSFTAMNDSALDFTMQLNGRIGQSLRESDWGDGQQLVKKFMEDVTSDETRCNVILNCHIKDVAKDGEASRLMPSALGKALPPEVPTKFNTMLEFRDTMGKKKILTKQVGMGLALKTSAPLKVKPEYELEWGLAEYFDAVRS